jgi:hypothetical protein
MIPIHWELLSDSDGLFISGLDYEKPIYQRKDGLATVYHNVGETSSPQMFGVEVMDDGECFSSLEEAITYCDQYIEHHLSQGNP